MTTFKLEPTSLLDDASTRMESLSTTTRKADAYIEDGPGTVEMLDGRWFLIALRDHSSVVTEARTNIQNSGKLLNAVSTNLDTAHGRYRATEQDNEVLVNDIFKALESPTTGQPPLSSRGTRTTFGTELPGDTIAAATPSEGIPEWAQLIIELGGSLVSPTYWAGKILQWTIQVNPIDWLTEQINGDWQGVTKAGDAFTKTSEYWTAMSNAIADDCGVMFRGWQGDAANSAQSYFRRLIEAHAEQAPALATLGAHYKSCGMGMYFSAKGMGALITVLLDMVAGAAILAAAIAIATASGIGAPAAAAMTAALTAWLEAILGVWSTVLTVQAVTIGACYFVAGQLAGFLATAKPVDQLEMPSEG